MARAAFIMDRLMSKAGLHGKSFIPMMSSFACAIPGVMAARAKVKGPFDDDLGCSADELLGALASLYDHHCCSYSRCICMAKTGLILGLYLVGIFGAFAMAWLFKKLCCAATPVLLWSCRRIVCPFLKM